MRILICALILANLCFCFDLQSIDNIKANFVQIITSDGTRLEYSGSFVGTKSKAYYEYIKPIKKQVFIDEKNATIYEPNLNQAIIIENKIGLVDILNHAKKDGDKITSDIGGNTFSILLDSSDMPQKIEYIDELDNKNELILSDVEINTDIDEGIFVFVAPKGIDIIHQESSIF